MGDEQIVTEREIACQQVLMEDSSVFSVQWLTVSRSYLPRLTPDLLLERYLSYIRRFTLSLIRPQVCPGGIEFRLLATATSLISFTGPVRRHEGREESLTLHICGGVLVQPNQCDRGELSFVVEEADDGVKLLLRLAEFCPLLLGSRTPSRPRKWLYRFTQAYLHKVVTVRFLARLYRELAGEGACVRVVRASVRQGENL